MTEPLRASILSEITRRGISVPAAALEMDLPRMTVWRWVKDGVSPSPGYARILRAWLDESRRKHARR